MKNSSVFLLALAHLVAACTLASAQEELQVNPAPVQAVPDTATADRALAEAIRDDLGNIATATASWAKAKKKPVKTKVTLKDILTYLPPDSPVATSGGNDRAGHPILFGTVESGPRISTATGKALNQSADFGDPSLLCPVNRKPPNSFWPISNSSALPCLAGTPPPPTPRGK